MATSQLYALNANGEWAPVNIEDLSPSLDGATINVGSEVEIKNDAGNPVPVLVTDPIEVTGTLDSLAGLQIPAHDYVSCAYAGDLLTEVEYKTGGVAGSTVARLLLTYTPDRKLATIRKV